MKINLFGRIRIKKLVAVTLILFWLAIAFIFYMGKIVSQ